MPSPEKSSVEDIETIKEKLVSLIEWLRTFPKFTGHSNINATCSEAELLEMLDDEALVNSLVEIAMEICGWSTPNSLRSSDSSPGSWKPIVLLAESEFPHFISTTANCPMLSDRVYLLSTLLGRAVSSNCPIQDKCVAALMGMGNKDAGRVLKTIIVKDQSRQEQQQPSYAGSRRNRDEAFGSTSNDPSDGTPETKKHANRTNMMDEYEVFSPDSVDSGLTEMVTKLQEENAGYQKKIEEFEQIEIELREKLENAIEEMNAKHRAEMVKVESAARQKEEDTRDELENEIRTLKTKVDELAAFQEEATSAQGELTALQDEVDILRHTKAKLEETETTLKKYQEKLENVADMKATLKREEDAHSSTVQENLRLKNELQVLQPLKRQLEDYKTRATDAEVKVAEYQDELKRMEHMSQTLNSTRKELLEGARIQQEEVEELRMRLCKEEEDGVGVGEGMSELNPAVKDEVLRLRNENEQLRAFAAKRSDDSVQKMEEELDDKERLSNQFKLKFLGTKSELERTTAALTESKEREEQLKAEIIGWTEKSDTFQKLSSQLQSELESTVKDLRASETSLINARASINQLEKDVTDWTDKATLAERALEEISNMLSMTKGRLEESEKCLRASKEREAALMQDINDCTQKLHKSQNESKKLSEQLADTMVSLVETKQALTESTERESSLKTDIEELLEAKALLKKSLEETLHQGQEALQAADERLKETIHRLTSEAQRDIKDVEQKLKLALEKEKNAFKTKLSDEEEKYSQLEETTSKDLSGLREKLSTSKSSEEELRATIVKMEEDHREQLERERKIADDEQTRLVRKGKDMLKAKDKVANEKDRQLELERSEWEEQERSMRSKHEDMIQESSDKLASFKQKLLLSNERVKELSIENDELLDEKKEKERELFALREENERFRRQIGVCFGADSKLQGQFETLQKEFDAVFEENKELQKKLKNPGSSSTMRSPFEQDSQFSDGHYDSSYSGGRSAMGQLREEHAETVQELNNEKRELVMKQSAYQLEVMKAQKRAQESDAQVEKLKEELTSVKLKLARSELDSELNSSTLDVPHESEIFEDKENIHSRPTDVAKRSRATVASPALSVLSPNRSRSSLSDKVQQRKPLPVQNVYAIDSNSIKTRVTSRNSLNKDTRHVPNLFENPIADGASMPGGQQECQQS